MFNMIQHILDIPQKVSKELKKENLTYTTKSQAPVIIENEFVNVTDILWSDLELFNAHFTKFFKENNLLNKPLFNLVQSYNFFEGSQYSSAGYQIILFLAELFAQEFGNNVADVVFDIHTATKNMRYSRLMAYFTSDSGSIGLSIPTNNYADTQGALLIFSKYNIDTFGVKHDLETSAIKNFIQYPSIFNPNPDVGVGEFVHYEKKYTSYENDYIVSLTNGRCGVMKILQDDDLLFSICDLTKSLIEIKSLNGTSLIIEYQENVKKMPAAPAITRGYKMEGPALFFPEVIGNTKYIATKLDEEHNYQYHIDNNLQNKVLEGVKY